MSARAGETGWLIERDGSASPPVYWDGAGLGGWTLDCYQAVRFARRIDAERASARGMLGATRICEHLWLSK